jgi:hypothetical protein
MRVLMIAVAVMTTGCANLCAKRDADFRENITKLIDCEYKWTQQDGITVAETLELQAGCYSLYQMRQRP